MICWSLQEVLRLPAIASTNAYFQNTACLIVGILVLNIESNYVLRICQNCARYFIFYGFQNSDISILFLISVLKLGVVLLIVDAPAEMVLA